VRVPAPAPPISATQTPRITTQSGVGSVGAQVPPFRRNDPASIRFSITEVTGSQSVVIARPRRRWTWFATGLVVGCALTLGAGWVLAIKGEFHLVTDALATHLAVPASQLAPTAVSVPEAAPAVVPAPEPDVEPAPAPAEEEVQAIAPFAETPTAEATEEQQSSEVDGTTTAPEPEATATEPEPEAAEAPAPTRMQTVAERRRARRAARLERRRAARLRRIRARRASRQRAMAMASRNDPLGGLPL
jgi:hypothetical protein